MNLMHKEVLPRNIKTGLTLNEDFNLSPEQIATEEAKLLMTLKEKKKYLKPEDFQTLINRIFEHSVEDGLRFCEELGLKSESLKNAIIAPDFMRKHEDLSRGLVSELKANKKYIDKEREREEIIGGVNDLDDDNFLEPKPNISWQLNQELSFIDNYYLNFLKLKDVNFKTPETIQGNTQQDRRIIDHLTKTKEAMEGRYYGGEIEKIIFKNIIYEKENEIKSIAEDKFINDTHLQEHYDNDFERYFSALKRGSAPSSDVVRSYLTKNIKDKDLLSELKNSSLLTKETVEKLGKEIDFSGAVNSKMINQAKYKPLDIVYNLEKSDLEKSLVNELNDSISTHLGDDKRVILDNKDNKYIVENLEVKDNESESGDSSKREKRPVKEVIIDAAPLERAEKINNHLYIQGRQDGESILIGPDGKNIGSGYEVVTDLREINNQLYFRAGKNDQAFVAGPNGKRVSEIYEGVFNVHGLTEINNELYYVVDEENKNFVVGPDGQKIGGYKNITDLIEVDKQLFFVAEENGQWFIVGPDGKKFTEEYDRVQNLTVINNELYFKARKDNRDFVVGPNGKIMGGKYDDINRLIVINNELYFKAQKDSKWFVVGPDGNKIGDEYDSLGSLIEINNKLYFKALQDDKWFIVGPDGRRESEEYELVDELIEINKKLYFKAKKEVSSSWFITGTNGIIIGDEFENVWGLTEINNELFFKARNDNKHFVVGPDGKRVGGAYDAVNNLTEINNELYFEALKDGKWFVVVPEGRRFSGEYDEIWEGICQDDKGEYCIYGKDGESLIKEYLDIENIDKVDDELSEAEKEKLDLLNLIHNPELDEVNEYLEFYESDEVESIDSTQASILSGMLNNSKYLLLDMMPAKKDRSVGLLSKRIIYKLFPEVLQNIRREEKRQNNLGTPNSFWNKMGFGMFGARGSTETAASQERHVNLENRSSAGTYEGGDGGREKGGKPMEVFKLRESISAMFANNIFGQYKDGRWNKIEFRVDKDINVPFKEITNTLLNVGNSFNISLPKPLEARIIPERVKGIRNDGTEVDLDIQVNALQEVICTSNENVKEIVYSFKMSEAFKPLQNVDEKNYGKFLNSVTEKESLVEDISDLNEELEIFIYSIKDKSPKERLIAIEKYVRGNSYYDDKNGEMKEMKVDKDISEVIDIMQLRAQELKETGINKEGKKFAGVCADFALLTTSLLRKSNIASGYLKGYKVSGKKATTEDAHGSSFALWPGDNGETRMIIVDGTPKGARSEFGEDAGDLLSTPSIKEREEEYENIKRDIEKKSIMTIDEIEAQMDTLSEEELKELSNGRLEEALNNLLSYNVSNSNLKRITKILEAYWYSPLSKLDLKNAEYNLQATSFLASELEKAEGDLGVEKEVASSMYGSELFNVLESYVSRFRKEGAVENTKSGLDVLEKVYELAKNDLNLVERKALSATINYLRAKNIKGKK